MVCAAPLTRDVTRVASRVAAQNGRQGNNGEARWRCARPRASAFSGAVGLRAVISPREVERIYDILKSPSKKSTATWNRRFRALNEKLNTGNLVEIAEVLRDLSSLRNDKDLSFGEKKMLERARSMIVAEISAAKNLDRCSVETELNHILLPI